MTKWRAFVTACLVTIPTLTGRAAHGQAVEIGAMAGRACQGSEASLCGSFEHVMWSGYVSAWLTEHLEAHARVGRVGLPEFSTEFTLPPESPLGSVSTRVSDRARTLWSGQAIYHAGRGRVRPYVGAGAGVVRESYSSSCAPAGCESFLASQSGRRRAVGAIADTFGAWIASVGVRGLIGRSAVVRAGLTFHNFGGGAQALTELSAGIGWRF